MEPAGEKKYQESFKMHWHVCKWFRKAGCYEKLGMNTEENTSSIKKKENKCRLDSCLEPCDDIDAQEAGQLELCHYTVPHSCKKVAKTLKKEILQVKIVLQCYGATTVSQGKESYKKGNKIKRLNA